MKISKILLLIVPILFTSNFTSTNEQSVSSTSAAVVDNSVAGSDYYMNNSELNDTFSETGEKKRVLFLGSYSIKWLSSPALLDEISNGLNANEYHVDYKYLNTKDIVYNEEYKEFLKEIYEIIFANQDPYDAVIISDDDALDFVMSNNSQDGELFYNLPCFFVGVNSEEKALQASEKDNICGLLESLNYKKSLQQVLTIEGNTDVVNYIADSTNTGEANAQAFEKAVAEVGGFTSINRINPSTMTLEEFEDTLSKIDSKEITYDLSFSLDIDGNSYNASQQQKIYSEYGNFPLFSDNNIESYAGTVRYDFNKAGAIIAEYVNDYFKNELDISKTSIILKDMNAYRYNVSELAKYDLNYKSLLDEENTEFVNFGLSFKYEYKNVYELIIIIVPFALIVLAVLVYYVFRNRKIRIEHNQKLEKLEYASSHDALTGLLQKDSFYKEVTELIRHKTRFALVVINIDNLNEANGYYGRDKGDDIVVSLVNLIESFPGFNYGFYSSDEEFQIVIPYKKRQELDGFVKQLNAISFSIKLDGINEKRISATAGISLYPENALIGSELLEHAYAAMQYGKVIRKHKAVFYNQTMKGSASKAATYNLLIETVKNDEFELFFQPIIDIKTGDIAKFEALLRIEDNDLSPSVFVPVAEEIGLINNISKKVLKMACDFERKMNECGVDKPISINFSSKQLSDDTFCDYFKEVTNEGKVNIKNIELDLTEDALLFEGSGDKAFFEFFNKEGISLSLDNFGTGFSSLDCLFADSIEYVKVDKDLAEVLCDSKDTFKKLIAFFHKANLKVVIEGIETKELVAICFECDADYIQGFYFSKPLLERETLSILTKNYLDIIK